MNKVAALETLLADANKARNRYRAEYLLAHQDTLRLQANLEHIRSGRNGVEYVYEPEGDGLLTDD